MTARLLQIRKTICNLVYNHNPTKTSSLSAILSQHLPHRPSKEDIISAPSLQAPDPEPSSSSPPSSPRPPPFSSLYFSPNARSPSLETAVTGINPSSLTAYAPASPFDDRPSSSAVAVAETKDALPRDTKGEPSTKSADDGEPPPPYTEGSSPLDSFTYLMAAAGGASSIITQVQQGGGPPINTLGGMCDSLNRTLLL